jgi:hypothetical protein
MNTQARPTHVERGLAAGEQWGGARGAWGRGSCASDAGSGRHVGGSARGARWGQGRRPGWPAPRRRAGGGQGQARGRPVGAAQPAPLSRRPRAAPHLSYRRVRLSERALHPPSPLPRWLRRFRAVAAPFRGPCPRVPRPQRALRHVQESTQAAVNGRTAASSPRRRAARRAARRRAASGCQLPGPAGPPRLHAARAHGPRRPCRWTGAPCKAPPWGRACRCHRCARTRLRVGVGVGRRAPSKPHSHASLLGLGRRGRVRRPPWCAAYGCGGSPGTRARGAHALAPTRQTAPAHPRPTPWLLPRFLPPSHRPPPPGAKPRRGSSRRSGISG